MSSQATFHMHSPVFLSNCFSFDQISTAVMFLLTQKPKVKQFDGKRKHNADMIYNNINNPVFYRQMQHKSYTQDTYSLFNQRHHSQAP